MMNCRICVFKSCCKRQKIKPGDEDCNYMEVKHERQESEAVKKIG